MGRLAGLLVTFLVAALVSEAAFAHGPGGRVRLGVSIGIPIGGPMFYHPFGHPYYPYHPYYGYPYPQPVIVAPAAQPQVWIERGQPDAPAADSWYFCQDSQAYYPYVSQCPGGWQRVAPRPSPG